MKRWINWLVIAAVVLVVLAYMTTYKVRFTEQAVVTTFGKADNSSVYTKPGLRFKIPYVQRETKYDVRQRFLESPPETVPTSDQRQVVVRAFLIWKVENPLSFYQKYSGQGDRAEDHYRAAEADLRGRLRSVLSAELSRLQLTDLLSATAKGSKLGDLEAAMLADLKTKGTSGTSFEEFGLAPVGVGITSIKFPQETTKKVFDAMNANRQKIANAAISQGKTQADTIRKTAESDAQAIMQFAERLARAIRSQGDAEASQYLAQMNEEPQLAVFLKQMEFMREAWGRQVTLVLATSIPGFEFFSPGTLGKAIKAGQIPVPKIKDGAAMIGEPPAPSTEGAGKAPGNP